MSEADRMVLLPDDDPLLGYYHGTFDAVFIAPHPFCTIPGVHPLDCEYGTQVFLRSEMPADDDVVAYMNAAAEERSREKKLNWEATQARILEEARPVSWQDMARAVGAPDPRHIDCALRTNIAGLRADLADEAGADALAAFCNAQGIFLPTEGHFQPLMQAAIVTLFQRAGARRVIVGDEFGDEEREVELTALASAQHWDFIPYGMKRIRDVPGSVLAIVHWDRFSTVIAATAEQAARIMPSTLFEGFWARPFTTINWFMEPSIPFGGPPPRETPRFP